MEKIRCLILLNSLALLTFYSVIGCGEEGGGRKYTYYLSTEDDILMPPSGTSDAIITIVGGEILGCSSTQGNTYYVSPNGNNNNPGTRDAPWATPGYGSRQLQPGDTLVILCNEGENTPSLAGRDNLRCAIDLSGVSYVKIINLEITSDNGSQFRDGIYGCGAQSDNITLEKLFINHLDEFGINMSDPNNMEITDCDITYCGFGSIGGPEGEFGGWRNVVIKNCNLSYAGHYYQGGPGPSPYDRPDGFGIEPSNGPIEIANTTAEHNRGDGLDSKAENTYIHECYVSNNSCDGVKLWGDGSKVVNCLIYGRGDGNTETTPWSPIVIGTEKANSSFEIVNTTVDDYVGNNYILYAQYDNPSTPINLTIKNTIFSARGDSSPIWLAEAVNYKIEYNLFYFPKSDYVLTHGNNNYDKEHLGDLGVGNKYGDPLFISPAFGTNGDYHVNNGSPAIDAGTSDGAPSIDLDGKTRPQGSGYDMGCYER